MVARSRQVFDHFDVKVKGAKEVEHALSKLDPDAAKALVKEKRRLAKNLAAKLRRAVISKTKVSPTHPSSGRPMGARVRPGIKQSGDTVTASNESRMLYGTEFGMNSKSGWYADERFRDSDALQYFRHQSDGYWWNPTIERSKPEADAAVKRVLDDTLSHWSA